MWMKCNSLALSMSKVYNYMKMLNLFTQFTVECKCVCVCANKLNRLHRILENRISSRNIGRLVPTHFPQRANTIFNEQCALLKHRFVHSNKWHSSSGCSLLIYFCTFSTGIYVYSKDFNAYGLWMKKEKRTREKERERVCVCMRERERARDRERHQGNPPYVFIIFSACNILILFNSCEYIEKTHWESKIN